MNQSDIPVIIEEKACECGKYGVKFVILESEGELTDEQVEARIKAFANGNILPLKAGETAKRTCPKCHKEISIP